LDGHAVLYNYGVEGDIYYAIDGKRTRIENNSLHVLNGSAIDIQLSSCMSLEAAQALDDETRNRFTLYKSIAGTTLPHAVQGEGPTSRKRLLVYADGLQAVMPQLAA
jgi:hypothetical protein